MRSAHGWWLCSAVMMLVLCATASAVSAEATMGIILVPYDEPSADIGIICDTLVAAVGEQGDYEVTVLHPNSPLLGAYGVPAEALQPGEADVGGQFAELAAALALDHILYVTVTRAAADAEYRYDVSVVWASADRPELVGFDLQVADTGKGAQTQLAERVGSQIAKGARELSAISDIEPPTAPGQPPEDDSARADSQAPTPDPAPNAEQTPAPTPEEGTGTATVGAPETEGPETEEKPEAAAPETMPEEDAADPSQQFEAPNVQKAREALAAGDLDLARQHLSVAAREGEPEGAIYLLRADIASVEGSDTERRKWLQRATVAGDVSGEARLRLADTFVAQGLWQKALDTYKEIIENNPDNVQAYLGVAQLLRQQQRPRKAAEYLSEALEKHPDNHLLLLKLGDAYRAANMLAEAEEAYDLLARSSEGELRAQVFEKLGDLYVGADRFDEGFYCYAEAARLQGDRDTPLSQKRYTRVMSTADEAVLAAMSRLADTYREYSVYERIPRERAYRTAEETVGEMEEVVNFARTIVPPPSSKRQHLQRKLFYSVALEAAVNLMTYLDTNLRAALKRYEEASEQADSEYRRLEAASGGA
ncbi:MAG: tetratricopeptide repeat protein [Armatimonadota bacterium]